jgi:toxin YoeB
MVQPTGVVPFSFFSFKANGLFAPQAWEDYQFWQKADKRTLKRIHLLIQDIQRSPQEGVGKHNLSGYWSRRITEEHRIVYKEFEHGITFVQMRYHYK